MTCDALPIVIGVSCLRKILHECHQLRQPQYILVLGASLFVVGTACGKIFEINETRHAAS